MKTINSLILGLLILCFASCSKDNNEQDTFTTPGVENKSIRVSLGGVATRASDPSDFIGHGADGIVNNVHIYVTDITGVIMAAKNVVKSDVKDSDWDKLTDKGLKLVNVGKEASKVYVYGNPVASLTSTGNIKAVNDTQIQLSTQFNTNNILYSGMDDEITPAVPEPIDPDQTYGNTYQAKVTIEPAIARMQVTGISFKTTGSVEVKKVIGGKEEKATVSWTGFTGDLVGIYLNNFHNYATSSNLLSYTGSELFVNSTYVGHIQNGQWLFGAQNTNAAAYASYIKYSGGTYQPLVLKPVAGKCYGFNFFPGGALPRVHFDLANLVCTTLSSTNDAVFNPSLFNEQRFLNIIKYKDDKSKEMTAADFKRGNIYDMEVEIMPAFLSDDLTKNQWNVLVTITVSQWKSNIITPGFEGQ